LTGVGKSLGLFEEIDTGAIGGERGIRDCKGD
jgi:hypothetical protein